MNLSNNIYLDNIYILIKYQIYDKFFLDNNIINIFQGSYFSFYKYDEKYINDVLFIIKNSFFHFLNLIQIKSKNVIFNSTKYEFHNFIEYKNNTIKLLEQALIGLNNFVESMRYYHLPSTDKYVKLINFINKKMTHLDEKLSIPNIEQQLLDSALNDSEETIIYLKPIQQSDRFNATQQNNVIDIPPLIQTVNYSQNQDNYNNHNNIEEEENIRDYINLYCANLYQHIISIISFR